MKKTIDIKGKTLYCFTLSDDVSGEGEIFTLDFLNNDQEAIIEMEKYHLDNNNGEDDSKYTIFKCNSIGVFEPQTKLVLSKKKKEDD